MKLSVIIVNYNVKYYLAQCLHSLEKALYGIESEIIVVDNHSRDNSVEYLRAIYPNVRYIENNHNDGFAKANNKAIRQAKGEYILLLNPDTIVGEQTIARAVNFLDMHPGSGTLGVKMLNTDGTYAMESRRGVPTPMTAFYKFTGLWKRYPNNRKFARYYMSYLSWDEPHKIDIVSGAFCMLKREVIEKVGLLDEDYFMYGEDIDLSYRIQKAGYTNWYLPVEILHYKGESTQKTSFRYVHVFYGAMYIFYRKHFPRFNVIFYPIVKLGVIVRAGMAMTKRLVKRLLPTRGKAPSESWPWVIVSDHPGEVAERAGIGDYQESIPQTGNYNVLVDDGCRTCSQVVDYIRANGGNDRLAFHIFADRHGIIISPKMS